MVNGGYYPNQTFLFEVRQKKVDGWIPVNILGASDQINEQFGSVWDIADEVVSSSLITTPTTVQLASTSGNDVNITGTGAWTILLQGVNGSTGELDSEVILLAGQTPVASIKTWYGINRILVLTTGSTGWNEGDIWCGNGAFVAGLPAEKFLMVLAEMNISHTAVYTNPATHRMWLMGGNLVSRDLDKGYEIRQILYSSGTGYRRLVVSRRGLGPASVLDLGADMSNFIPPLSLWRIDVKSSKGVGSVSAYVDFLLEEV